MKEISGKYDIVRNSAAMIRALPRETIEQLRAFANLSFDPGGEAPVEGCGMGGIALNRVWQRGRQQRGLVRIELARALMEVVARRGLDSVEAVAPFGNVEIDLERTGFGPGLAEHERHAD